MAQNYEDIVREWYTRLRPEFLRRLTAKYSGLTLYDAENLYQDAFLAVHENLLANRVKEDTSWSDYIMTIGLNLASKEWRRIGKTDSADEATDNDSSEDDGFKTATARKVEDILKELPDGNAELPFSKDPEAQAILGYELKHTPYPCGKLIKMFYANEDMTMDDVAEEFGYKNAATAKQKKSQCMTDLIKRVTDALNRAGFDVKPKKRNRNGKN